MTNPKIRKKRAVLARLKGAAAAVVETVVEKIAEPVAEALEEVAAEVEEAPKPSRRRKKNTLNKVSTKAVKSEE